MWPGKNLINVKDEAENSEDVPLGSKINIQEFIQKACSMCIVGWELCKQAFGECVVWVIFRIFYLASDSRSMLENIPEGS